ncbi:hypothetical protein EON65_46470 [archaeon]|nr:MAG: hypothetical protein EON65_46470 [archaeon]
MTDIVAPLDYLITLKNPERVRKMVSIGIGKSLLVCMCVIVRNESIGC